METQERRKEFGRFLIQRFVMIIVGIVLCEIVLSVLYIYYLFPWFSEWLDLEPLKTLAGKEKSLRILGAYLAALIIGSFQMLLPEGARKGLGWLFGFIIPVSWQQGFGVFSNRRNAGISRIIYLGYFAIGLLLLAGLLLPLVVGALLYSRMVRLKVQELIEEDQQRTRAEQKRKNILLSDIAHDLKTPMTTVAGYAQALNEGMVTTPGKQREYLNVIAEKTQKMNSIVELLLEYARLEGGGLVLHREMVDIAEYLRQLAAEFYEELEMTEIELIVDIPEEEYLYEIDSLQFGRMVTNLLQNARKHMETGAHILLRLRRAEGRDGFRLLVADDGIPIGEELGKHLFEPFVMGDVSRNSRGGSGLGLSIAAQIAKLHGGRIWLDSISTEEYTKAFVIEV